jgi:hypothetical protein
MNEVMRWEETMKVNSRLDGAGAKMGGYFWLISGTLVV